HECGAERDLCLAEADIAADQTVHGFALGEVLEHVLDRMLLVVGLLPGEALDELVEGTLLGFEDRCLAQRTSGGRAQKLVGDLADALLETRPSPLPRLAAQTVEERTFLAAAIAAEHIDVLDRDVELVASVVLEHHAVVLALA